MQSQLESQILALAAEKIESEQTQKTNLEEQNHHKHHNSKKHKKAKAHRRRSSQRHGHSLMQTSEHVSGGPAPAAPAATPKQNSTKPADSKKAKPAPKATSLINTKAKSQDEFDKFAQNVDVPIDEVKAITLKVSPTFTRDHVESVTLKSFRKVVGYDTFNSILKGDRNEKKDISDHYNVTVSMMIQRIPEETAAAPARDPYNGGKSLAESLDKGFPYDDGDSSPDNMTPNWKNH
jgi:hypothetical protein